jgi:hypothetical protein
MRPFGASCNSGTDTRRHARAHLGGAQGGHANAGGAGRRWTDGGCHWRRRGRRPGRLQQMRKRLVSLTILSHGPRCLSLSWSRKPAWSPATVLSPHFL